MSVAGEFQTVGRSCANLNKSSLSGLSVERRSNALPVRSHNTFIRVNRLISSCSNLGFVATLLQFEFEILSLLVSLATYGFGGF